MADAEEWVIWNGSMGVLDMVAIGRIEEDMDGRRAFLAPPYGTVGPFSLDALEREGRIAFGACLVMSRLRWREDQAALRMEAQKQRRAFLLRSAPDDTRAHREALDLPGEGPLEPSEINAAFRRLAKIAHPDAGGSDAHYRRIAEARDMLLELIAGTR